MRGMIITLLGGGSWLALGVPAIAQSPRPTVSAPAYTQSARRNAEMLRQYTWTMRVVLTADEKQQPPQLYLMRFDPSGKLQKTPITVQKQKTYRGFLGKKKKKKADEMKQYLSGLSDLVKNYTAPTPDQMAHFFTRAQYAPQPNGTVKVAGTNFLQQGDSVSYAVNQATKQPVLLSFSTELDSDRVTGTVQYEQVPKGPRYAAQTMVSVPTRKLHLQVDTFDYAPKQP